MSSTPLAGFSFKRLTDLFGLLPFTGRISFSVKAHYFSFVIIVYLTRNTASHEHIPPINSVDIQETMYIALCLLRSATHQALAQGASILAWTVNSRVAWQAPA